VASSVWGFDGQQPILYNKELKVPFLDMYFILKHIDAGTWVIIDDYCEEHGSSGVNEAVDEFIRPVLILN
jgi:succinate dehydrogenase hydrophobic anchor subunit